MDMNEDRAVFINIKEIENHKFELNPGLFQIFDDKIKVEYFLIENNL